MSNLARGIARVGLISMVMLAFFALVGNVLAAVVRIDSMESGWTYSESDPSGRFVDNGVVTNWYTEGAGSMAMTYNGLTIDATNYMMISKSIQLTGIDNLRFDYKKTLDGGSGARVVFRMSIGVAPDNVTLWTAPQSDQQENGVTVDISAYSGLQTISWEYIHLGGTAWDEAAGSIWVDNLTTDSDNCYAVRLYWEENNTAATSENGTLTSYMTNYGTQEYDVVNGALNVKYPERPKWMKLTHGSYSRTIIPSADNGTLYFYVASSTPTSYNFTLSDLVGGYGPPDGALYIYKWIGSESILIHSDYWSADYICSAYLILGDKYQFAVVAPGKPQRYVGDITMSSVTDRVIQVSPIAEELLVIFDYVSWGAWRVDNSTIRAEYQDNLDNTLSVSVTIYCENGDVANQWEPDNEWFIVTWTEADENESYNVVLDGSHSTYGDFVFSIPIGLMYGPPSTDGIGNPFDLPFGLTLAGIGSIILVGVVGLSFDSLRVQLGMLGMAMTVLFCWYMGFLPLPGPYDGAFTGTLIFVMAVLFAITWRRGK